jgi:hypothetical protein
MSKRENPIEDGNLIVILSLDYSVLNYLSIDYYQ